MNNAWKAAFAGLMMVLPLVGGCDIGHKDIQEHPYGREGQLFLPGVKRLVWAVAPTIDLSGQKAVDPLLQSDLVFQELQQVHGLTVVPVDRVVQVYASLRIKQVQSAEQAWAVCQALGCDGLLVPTVTAFDPYDPPKMGASLVLFVKPGSLPRQTAISVHDLVRSPAPGPDAAIPELKDSLQVVGMYDAAAGTTRARAEQYALGRSDPDGPYSEREVFVSMDRYGAFVYHELIADLLAQLSSPPVTAAIR